MSDEIPADVMLAAVRAIGQPDVRVPRSVHKDTSLLVARAILAERERCAAIAQKLYDDWDRAPSWEVSKLPPNAAAAASSIRSSS